jgi:hypothetical protein
VAWISEEVLGWSGAMSFVEVGSDMDMTGKVGSDGGMYMKWLTMGGR